MPSELVNSHNNIVTAFKIFWDWPQSFYRFLDAVRQNNGQSSADGPQKDLGALYPRLERRWRGDDFAFLQDAYNSYFIRTYERTARVRKSGRFRNNPGLLQQAVFSICRRLQEYLAYHLLPTYLAHANLLTRVQTEDLTHLMFRREEVEALDRKWRDAYSLSGAAAELVFPMNSYAIFSTHALAADRGPRADGSQEWK